MSLLPVNQNRFADQTKAEKWRQLRYFKTVPLLQSKSLMKVCMQLEGMSKPGCNWNTSDWGSDRSQWFPVCDCWI